MPKLGLGLSLPQTRFASASLIPSSGLSLWLKADAGVTTLSYSYTSSITLSEAGESSVNGSYTASAPGNGYNNYLMNGPNSNIIQVRPNSTPRYRLYNLDNYTNPNPWFYSFTSSNGSTWTAVGKKPVSITLSGLTGTSSTSNGTYNAFQFNPENQSLVSSKSVSGGFDDNALVEIYPNGSATALLLSPTLFVSAEKTTGWGIGAWDLVEGTGSPVGTGTLYPTGGVPTGAVTTTNVNTSNVTSWEDQSGNGNNFISASGTVVKSNNIIGSNPAILFDGGSLLGNDIVTAKTIYAVIKTLETSAEQYAVIFEATGGSLYSAILENQWGSYYGSGSPSGQTIQTETAAIIATLSDDGETYKLRTNGQEIVSSQDGNGFVSRSTAYLGSDSSFSQAANVYISEIIVYNRVPVTAEIQQIEAYLMDKYAIAPLPSGIVAATAGNLNISFGYFDPETYTKLNNTEWRFLFSMGEEFQMLEWNISIPNTWTLTHSNGEFEATNPSTNSLIIPTTGWTYTVGSGPAITITAA